jgi:hypothetical protein
MNQLANALGAKFVENKELLRIRTFDFNGVTFKVKVPLTVESDLMYERNRVIDDSLVLKFYGDMAREFIENTERYANDSEIIYKDDDIIVKGISLKETAKNKVLTQNRILDLFKLIVPEDASFDMNAITYQDIDDNFPFNIQLELLNKISEVIAPGYIQTKGK